MSKRKVDQIEITYHDGILKFEDPRREAPLILKYEDFPLLLDLLDSVKWDRRRVLRVPVASESGLATVVESEGVDHTVHASDISKAGISISFSESENPRLSINETVNVTLQLGTRRTTLLGTVRRHSGHEYGIDFASSLGDDNAMSESFRHIVSELETAWLHRRVYGHHDDKVGV